MPEANQEKTWWFVRYGLLGHQGFNRPFQVIEDELHFVHDFFYTKYGVLGTWGDSAVVSKIIYTMLYLGCGIYVTVQLAPDSVSKKIKHCEDNLQNYVLDVGATKIVLAIIILQEIVQLAMLILSNWTIVNWMVNYVKSPKSLNKFKEIILTKLLPLAHQWNLKQKPWSRKLGQYSFLERYARLPLLLHIKKLSTHIYPFKLIPLSKIMTLPRSGQVQDMDINLSEGVKRAVVESLTAYNEEEHGVGLPKLTNGITSLNRNGIGDSLSWACQSDSQAKVVMVWHIATTIICQRETPSCEASKHVLEDFHAATSLSKYCAYLVAFAPELLPGHPFTTQCVFDGLVSKAKCLFGEGDHVNMESKIQILLGIKENKDSTSVECSLEKGGIVAQIMLKKVKNQVSIWKVLAEFWVEMILFLAPSDNAMAHAERLANGGEFITHLWALLTHAGILTKESG